MSFLASSGKVRCQVLARDLLNIINEMHVIKSYVGLYCCWLSERSSHRRLKGKSMLGCLQWSFRWVLLIFPLYVGRIMSTDICFWWPSSCQICLASSLFMSLDQCKCSFANLFGCCCTLGLYFFQKKWDDEETGRWLWRLFKHCGPKADGALSLSCPADLCQELKKGKQAIDRHF